MSYFTLTAKERQRQDKFVLAIFKTGLHLSQDDGLFLKRFKIVSFCFCLKISAITYFEVQEYRKSD